MPSLPPPSAFRRARELHHAALAADRGSEVTIGGRPYKAVVELGAVGHEPTERGVVRMQRLTARILKTEMRSPPPQKQLVYHDSVEFSVSEVGGRNATDASWVIRCLRFID